MPAHQGACGRDTAASGQSANHCSQAPSTARPAAAASQAGGSAAPSRASGVTSSVTQGMANRFATRPTSETWPNSSSVNGASATVTTSCSRSSTSSRAPTPRALPGPGSDANNTPTATKLSQKPAWVSAQGSASTTTPPTSSQTAGQGQWRADSRNTATAASIQTVRCAGTPQPLNSA